MWENYKSDYDLYKGGDFMGLENIISVTGQEPGFSLKVRPDGQIVAEDNPYDLLRPDRIQERVLVPGAGLAGHGIQRIVVDGKGTTRCAGGGPDDEDMLD